MHVEPDRSSLTFVYPFLFAAERVDSIIQRLEGATASSRDGLMPVWQPLRVETEDWLPHLAESLHAGGRCQAIVACFQVTGQFLQSRRGLSAANGFQFAFRDHQRAPVTMHLVGLQAFLFRNGTGFIVQRWKPQTDSPADWLDIQHFGHFSALERGGQLSVAAAGSAGALSFPDPFGLRGEPSLRDPLSGTFEDLTLTALASGGLARNGSDPIRDVFVAGRLLPYNVLFVRSSEDREWPLEKVLYKLRRMFHAAQAHYPSGQQLEPAEPQFLTYLQNQWFYFSLEGGGFVACDAPDDHFFGRALPNHLETSYFLIFLLALQQRFSLMALSADVARHWRCDDSGAPRRQMRAVFERTRDRLFDFTARYYFVQAVQRENHHLCYQRWQEIFQTRDLYEEVSAEVHAMSESLRDRDRQVREDRVGLLTLLLTVLIGAPSLAIGFWNINIVGYTSNEGLTLGQAIWSVGGVSAGIGGLFCGLWAAIRVLRASG